MHKLAVLMVVGAPLLTTIFSGIAHADDDCQWRVIGRNLVNVGNGGGNCPGDEITAWCKTVYTEENSCTGQIQQVDGGTVGYCMPNNHGSECPGYR